MNKDVIYIDVDDDVTAIIGKIKNAKEKIVALVPPKRPGALQSAVNLRLLERMAKADNKQLVLISNNQALMALAANAQIPVAKNLQSKPEVAEVPALVVDDGDDIIDGNDVPVGEYAAGVAGMKIAANKSPRDDAMKGINVEKDSAFAPMTVGSAAAAKKAAEKGGKKAGSKFKIPNFDTFRKKLFIGLAALVLVVGVLVWALVFAPSATVLVTARTSQAPLSGSVTLSTSQATNYDTGVIRATAQTEKKAETIEFDATGTKDVGEKAKGTMTVSRTSVSSTALSVPAGTAFSAGGLTFTSTQSVTLDGTTIGPGGIVQDSATVNVQAQESGDSYNLSSRSYQASVGGISAQGSTMSGGTSKQAKVPTDADVERARGDILGRSTDEMKQTLAAKFSKGEKIIDSSFTVERAAAVSSPAVGAEASNGKATLSIETTYTMFGVAKSDLDDYLDAGIEDQILDDTNQRVFENGHDSATFSNFQREGANFTAGLSATGQIGPKLDEADIKELVKGKIYGEAKSALESIEGVQDVDVKFPYFWVRTIPEDTNKITVEFTLNDE